MSGPVEAGRRQTESHFASGWILLIRVDEEAQSDAFSLEMQRKVD